MVITSKRMTNLYQEIPQIAKILKMEAVLRETASFSYPIQKGIVTKTIDQIKNQIKAGLIKELSEDFVVRMVIEEAKRTKNTHLYPVLNATGTLLHTNLGRAVFDEDVIQHATDVLRHYTNLEYDLQTGSRSNRYEHLKDALLDLVGAEDYLLVNNNAAAVSLVVHTFAQGKSVLLSRGEMVEIGEGFRIHEIMESSGARVVEVGSTNRTTIDDYKKKISDEGAMIYKVHPSNFKISGYTDQVKVQELSKLCPVFYDLGSGNLVSEDQEESVKSLLKEGATLVSVSGDKLLGGPQVGIIFGSSKAIQALKQNPLLRALRVDKVTIALLEGTLLKHLTKSATKLDFLWDRPNTDLLEIAEDLVKTYPELSIVETKRERGGGTTPTEKRDSVGVKVAGNPNELMQQFRELTIPVIGRIERDAFLLDLATITDFELLKEALKLWKVS